MKVLKIFIVLLFICLTCMLNIVKSDDLLLGEVEITEKSFTIDASVVNTKFSYVIDDTIKTPKLVVTSVSGDATDIDDIVKVSDDKKSVTFGDYTDISPASKLIVSSGPILLISAITSLLSIGLIRKSSRIMMIIMFIGIFSILNVTQSVTLSQVSVRVDIRVPSSFKFDSLKLTLGSGSSNIVGLNTHSLEIDGCTNLKDHSIELNQISISTNLIVCSTKDINIKELQLSSTNVLINLTSSANVNLEFQNGYSGTVLIDSDISSLSGCDTTENSGVTSGNCNGGTSSKLNIKAPSGLTVITNVEITCPIENNWRVTPAADIIPTSRAISTTTPATEFGYNKDNLLYLAEYAQKVDQLETGPVDNSFAVNRTVWGPSVYYLAGKTQTPTLKANVNYQFSLGVKLQKKLDAYNKIANMSIYFFDPKDFPNPNGSSQYFKMNQRVPLFSQTFNGTFTSDTEFVTTSFQFKPTIDIGASVFVLQVNYSLQSGPLASLSNTLFKDIKITVPGKTITTPTLLTKDSELITIPKPAAALDPQDSTTCAYKATDLVHWHNPSTWANGVVPPPSSNIVIPEGKRVLISPCSISQTEIYKKITIPATSELIFSDAAMTFNVQDIYVQGKLTMGTTKCRYNAKINVIFHGEKTTQGDTIAQFFGSKGIAVASTGFISVHGKQYHNTWTKLAATAWSGDRVIYVQDAVNWEVGQQVLLTTSYYQDELNNQNEVMTIAAIQGKVVEFTESLKFYHYGGQEYQAEVALLSRRIIFQGDAKSSDAKSFGGHVLVNGEGQFAGLQLIKMGQTNVKARYPLHYHLAKVVKNSYISDCSVTNSFYRCYTIHGTNNATVTRNVAFDVRGHCYYLEDGVEMDNTLSFNLAAYVHPIGRPAAGAAQVGEIFVQNENLTQPADSSAAGFYITNAWNSIIGNSASGGWAGFAFPGLWKPIGNHRTETMIPAQYRCKVFEGNTAHSSGYFFTGDGASIYVGGNLTHNEADGLLYYNTGRVERNTFINGTHGDAWMRFNNTKIYLSNRGLGHWGTRVEVVGFESHDSLRPATLFGDALLSDAIVNGRSGNLVRSSTNKQGFQFYDTYVKTILTRINFRNFIEDSSRENTETDNRVIISMTHSDVFKPQGISAIRAITLTNVATSQIIGHRITNTGSSRFFNFIDWDSSLIPGRTAGQPTLVGSHDNWWQFDNTCSYNLDWACWVCDKGTKEIGNLQFWITGLTGGEHPADSYIGNITLFGSGITNRRTTIITRNNGVTGVSNMGWYLYLTGGTPTYMKIWLAQVVYGQHIFLAIPYPAQTTFSIKSQYLYDNKWNNYTYAYTQAGSAAEVREGDGKKYFFDGQHLFIKAVNLVLKGTPDEYFERDGVKIYDVHWQFYIIIDAVNTVTPPVSGYFKGLPDVLPSSSL